MSTSVHRGGALAVAVCALALPGAAGAAAEPAEPPPIPGPTIPEPAPPIPESAPEPAPAGLADQLARIGNAMGQTGSAPTGPLGLPDLSALGPTLLLAQNPAPTAPGVPAPPEVPSLSAFDPAYLIPLNIDPAAPGEGAPAPGIGPDADSPGTGRLAFLQRLHDMYAAGQLRGALLGQQPPAP